MVVANDVYVCFPFSDANAGAINCGKLELFLVFDVSPLAVVSAWSFLSSTVSVWARCQWHQTLSAVEETCQFLSTKEILSALLPGFATSAGPGRSALRCTVPRRS